MSDLAVLASDPGALDDAADPGEYVVLACERAKTWLTQALEHGDVAGIVQTRAQAEAVRIMSLRMQMGKDAELAACEIIRRAERGIGLAIRKGQADGEVRSRGVRGRQANQHGESAVAKNQCNSVEAVSGMSRSELSHGPYALADDVPDETFEEAIAEAKAEGQLTRANVVRKVKAKKPNAEPLDRLKAAVEKDKAKGGARVAKAKEMAAAGYTSRQIADTLGIEDMAGFRRRHEIDVPADATVGKTARIDSNRVVSETVTTLEGLVMGVDLVNVADLDPDQLDTWAESLHQSLLALNRFRKQLAQEARP